MKSIHLQYVSTFAITLFKIIQFCMHICTPIYCKFWSSIIPSLSSSIAHARVKAFTQKLFPKLNLFFFAAGKQGVDSREGDQLSVRRWWWYHPVTDIKVRSSWWWHHPVTDITWTGVKSHWHHSSRWKPNDTCHSLTALCQPDIFSEFQWKSLLSLQWWGARRSTRCTKVTSLSGLKVKSYHSGKNVLTSPPPSELLQVTINPTVTQYYPPRRSQLPDQCACNMCFPKQWETTSFPHSPHFTWYHCK